METVDLTVQKRDTGKQNSKQLRRNGLIPGVYYAKGETGLPIAAKPLSMRNIIYTSDTKMIHLSIDGEPGIKTCVLKEIKFDPLSEAPIHFDLIGVVSDKKMHFEVPIILKGNAIGAREGGIIQHNQHKVTLECLPADLPTHIEIDITNLKLGRSIHLKDVKVENTHFLLPDETVIVTCVPPRVTGESKHEQTEIISEVKEEAK